MSKSARRSLKWYLGLVLGSVSATLLAAAACNHAPDIDSTPFPVAEVGQTYTYAVHATDPDGNAITYSLLQGPQGMAYSTSAQRVEWTPTASQVGTTTVKVQAKDSWGATDQQSYSLRVVADFCEIYPITIPQQLLTTAQPGTSLGQIDRGTGPGNFSWLTWAGSTSATTLATSLAPPGDSYNYVNPDNAGDRLLEIGDWAQGSTGSMNSSAVRERMDALKTRDIVIPTWTSVRGQGSKFDYKVIRFATVRLLDYQLNGQGWLKLKFQGYKNCYNDAPSSGPQSLTTPEDTALPLTLAGSDPESDALQYLVVSSPQHGQLTGSGSDLVYTPAPGYSGPDGFSYRTSDGEFDSAVSVVSIQVLPVDDPPQAADLSLSTDEDVPLPVTLQGADPEGSALSYRIVQPPMHGSLQGSGATLTYVPEAEWNGSDSFTYVANDGVQDSPAATANIVVRPVNDAPTAHAQQVQTDEDVALPIRLTGTDPEGEPLSFRIVGQPMHGQLTGAGDDWVYAPEHNFAGEDSFGFVVNDGSVDSAVATVHIAVIERNAAPVAQELSYEVRAGASLSISLAAQDPDGDAISYRVTSLPGHGELGGDAPDLHFLAEPGFAGTLDFSYVANDGRLDSPPATVSIRVLPANPPKFTTVPANFVDERMEYEYDADAFDPDEGDELSFSLDRSVDGGLIKEGSGIVRWQPPSWVQAGGVRDVNRACKTPAPPSTFDPVLKWGRSGPEAGSDLNTVFGPPLVGQLSDDNGDGRIDAGDRPDVLVMSGVTSSSGAMIALSGDTGQTLWQTRLPFLAVHATPAIGDIDGDGKMEIAVVSARDGAQLNLLENDGTLKWSVAIPAHSAPNDLSRDAPFIADFEGDGMPEIVRGATIVNSNGTVRCTGGNDKGGTSNYAYISVVADVDLDGQQELIAGRSIYDSQCRLIRQLGAANDGYDAVGNFDADPYPEIVIVSNGSSSNNGSLYIYKTNGTRLAGPIAIPQGGTGGPPTLANVDDDPYPEIGVAGKTRYVLFDNNGAVRWTKITQDVSSNQTGSTFFDFEGDGAPEIVYGDEENVFFWDGRTGALRYTFANVSGTTMEYPVVADVDGDHSADVVVGFNGAIGGGVEGGVRVISSAGRAWPDARPLWNQHAFSITNINDDGSIPRRPEPSWLAHNSFRLNALSSGQSRGMPDLALFDLRLDAAASAVHLTVVNRGLAATDAATLVRIFDGSPSDRLLGTLAVPSLQSGESMALRLDDVDIEGLRDELTATVDNVDAVAECAENNNMIGAQLFHARVTDGTGLFDTQLFSVGVLDVNEAPVFVSRSGAPPRIGQYFTSEVRAVDPDLGDGLLYTLVSGPAGMVIEPVSGELRWTPTAAQAGDVSVTVRVTDLRGLSSTDTFMLSVPPNHAPVIDSAPTTEATATEVYEYEVEASDIDGDLLSYSLVSAPEGMVIHGVNGRISWTPAMSQTGSFNVTFKVVDPQGASATQTFAVQVSLPINHPPAFATQPLRVVALGQRYQYDARATDPDGDTLAYSLLDAPLGMAVDTVTGTIVWQPGSAQVGEHAIVIQALDSWGASVTQSFHVLVSQGVDEGNHPPSIDSAPRTSAVLGEIYSYAIEATDIDGDALSYSLDSGPDGMLLDTMHRLVWTPLPEQAGLHEVRITVRDAHGATASQWFGLIAVTVPVDDSSGNHPPSIDSDPLTRVSLGQTYRYYATASDADGDALTFALLQSPEGMSIDATTGVIAWTPSTASPVTVQLRVDDGRGAAALQTYTLVVQDAGSGEIDHRPVLLSPPFGFAKAGQTYRETLQVADADGEALSYSLLSGPQGAIVDARSGEFVWTPASAGAVNVLVRAQAGTSYTDIGWTLEVAPAEKPLQVQVQITPDRVAPGGAMTVQVAYEGAGSRPTVQADINGAPLTLDEDGSTALAAPVVSGHYLVTVQVNDGVSLASDAVDLYIADPSDHTPPTVQLTSPAVDARITAPTAVQGSVVGVDVARWTLSLYDKASGNSLPIAEGHGAAGPGVLGTLDPTLLMNGFHTLVLQAWDNGGNQASTSRAVLIEGDMKIGHFSVSFEDVSVPMAGFPLRVTRTYDTRQRQQRLDFGFGWSVDYQNIRLTESRTPGYSWSLLQERNGYFGNWCVRPNGDPIVAVTAPDGKLMKFRAKASPECQFLTPQTDVRLVFEALPGTDAQLVQEDFETLRLASVAGSGVYNLISLTDPQLAPADPTHYRLKLPDGTVYSLQQGLGITHLGEPDGNELTFNRDGVYHSRGAELRFLRDGQGRIDEIRLPEGGRRRYTYTNAGDLEMVVDEVEGITSFAYAATAPHYLRDIVDPRGVRVSRNEYDEDGRLVATIDADGHRIVYTHNLAGRSEIVRDRRGNASIYAYDEQGRVTAESNALGETTLHSYDAFGNELSTTDPLGHTTSRVFDARGNVLRETDPLGGVTLRTYSPTNQLLTQTDPLGRVVSTNTYHAYNGKLVSTTNAVGETSSFEYDSGIFSNGTGELVAIVDGEDAITHYEVNQFGHRNYEYDALDNQTVHVIDLQGRERAMHTERTLADGSRQTLYTRYELDAKARVVATVHPDGSRTTSEYDGNDKPVKTCDALNRCTLQHYNARGELDRTTYPDGTFEETSYDENGNVIARRDRGGRTTKMVYDAANRLVETILPDDAQGCASAAGAGCARAAATPASDADNPRTRSEYDVAGRLVASVDELGHRTEYGYDAAGRRIWVKDALGHITTTDYDAAGQRVAVTDALGHTTRFVYDLAGRLVETVHPDDSRTRIAYDRAGRKRAETDELGRIRRFVYDKLGRLLAVVLPDPATGENPELVKGQSPAIGTLTTRYGYDEVGNKVSQTDALGRVTRWEYDAMGRQVKRVLPLGQSESMQYDVAGQLSARTDFNGVTVRYSYDLAGRLAGVDHASDADIITTYTASGQRESVTDGQGTTMYQYDARDRLLGVSTPDGNAIAYEYDAAGNKTALHSPALDQVFAYDPLNRLIEVRSRSVGGAERVAGYGYDAVGNRTSLTQADGTVTTTAYDARNRLRQLLTHSAASALLFGATYTVDATGARTAIAEFSAAGPTRSVAYAYDGTKRLVAETIARPGQADRTTSYVYDAVGNRLSRTSAGVITTYVVDANDRLITETSGGVSTLYTYDANGNTTGKAKPGEWTRYGYDEENRLVGTTTSAGASLVTGYNADGIRNRETANGTATSWLIDPNRDYAQTLEAYEAQGCASAAGAGCAGAAPGELITVWQYGDSLLSQSSVVPAGLRETQLHADGMGSVRLATDALGTVTDGFEYDAFGNELSRTGSTAIDHRYRGEQLDPNTGLYNLRARWYDPSVGRFATQDTWAGNSNDPISLHKYLYANAEPVMGRDPSGHYTMSDIMVGIQNLSISVSVRIMMWSWRHPILAAIGPSIAGSVLLPTELQVPTPMTFSPQAMGATTQSIAASGKHLSGTMRLFRDKLGTLTGAEFEQFVATLLRIEKNRKQYNVDLSWKLGARFVPDFLRRGGFLETKAVRTLSSHDIQQAEKLAAYSAQNGVPLEYLFLKKPNPEDIKKLEQAIAEGSQGAQVSFGWNYIFE